MAALEPGEWTQLLRVATGSEERKELLGKKKRGMKPAGREEQR